MTYQNCPICGKIPCMLNPEQRRSVVEIVVEKQAGRLQRLLQLDAWTELAPGAWHPNQEAAEAAIRHAVLRLECWQRHISDALRAK